MKRRRLTKNIKNEEVKRTFAKKNVLWITVTVFVLVQIFLTLRTSTSGAELAELENRQIELQNENKRLSEELVMRSSLSTTEEKAQELGFVRPEDTLYLGDESSVSLLP